MSQSAKQNQRKGMNPLLANMLAGALGACVAEVNFN